MGGTASKVPNVIHQMADLVADEVEQSKEQSLVRLSPGAYQAFKPLLATASQFPLTVVAALTAPGLPRILNPFMATAPSTFEQRFVLQAVLWKTYEHLLRAFADRLGVRLTYDRGTLELRTLSHEHESLSMCLKGTILL